MSEPLTFLFKHLLTLSQAGDAAATRLLHACLEATINAAETDTGAQHWLTAHVGIVQAAARTHDGARAWLTSNGLSAPPKFDRSLGPNVRPPETIR
jgi:hypothetical protein